ncbi:hypothetical protein GCM10010372_26490 [Streptomyces tauricus]|nr:hypothetical protein GCM10010372_26490 [Streptomyces tauricus]
MGLVAPFPAPLRGSAPPSRPKIAPFPAPLGGSAPLKAKDCAVPRAPKSERRKTAAFPAPLKAKDEGLRRSPRP